MKNKSSLSSNGKQEFMKRLIFNSTIVYLVFVTLSVTLIIMGDWKIIDGFTVVLFTLIFYIIVHSLFEYLLGFSGLHKSMNFIRILS